MLFDTLFVYYKKKEGEKKEKKGELKKIKTLFKKKIYTRIGLKL